MAQSKKTKAKKKSPKVSPAKTKNPRNKAKGKETRAKILEAARHIFSNYAYRSATIRMIGKLAEIEHPLISYYFPNKADLFITVLKETIERQHKVESEWLDEVKAMTTERGLSVFIDHQLDFFRQHPEVFCIIALNKVQFEDGEQIPGYRLFQESIESTVKTFMEKVPMIAPEFEVEMYCRTLLNHLTNFLGASKFHASIMNMDPTSIQYLNWVKDATLYVFLPRLKMMVKRAIPNA